MRPQAIYAIRGKKDNAEEYGTRLCDDEHERAQKKGEDINSLDRMRHERVNDTHEQRGDHGNKGKAKRICVQGTPVEDEPGKPDKGQRTDRPKAHGATILQDSCEQKQDACRKQHTRDHIVHGIEGDGNGTGKHIHDERAHEMPERRIEASARQRCDNLVFWRHIFGDIQNGPYARIGKGPNRLHVKGVVIFLREGIGRSKWRDVYVYTDDETCSDIETERLPVKDAHVIIRMAFPAFAHKTNDERNGTDYEHRERDVCP